MKSTFRQEMWYVYKSRILAAACVAALMIIALAVTNVISVQKEANRSFAESRQLYKSDEDFQNDLKSPFKITSDTVNSNQVTTTVDNVARYTFENLVDADNQMTPGGFVRFVFGNFGLSIIPIILGVVAIYFAAYDYTSGTYKRKLDRSRWGVIYSSKLGALIFTTIILYTLITLTSLAVGAVLSGLPQAHQDLSAYGVTVRGLDWESVVQSIGVAVAIGIVQSLVWFSVGIVIRRQSVAILVFLTYHAVIPNLGKYDYKNALLQFSTLGRDHLVLQPLPVFNISLGTAVALLLVYLFIIVSIGTLFFGKYARYHLA